MATVDNDIETGFATGKVVLAALAVIVFAFAISLFIRGGFLAAVGQEYDWPELPLEVTETRLPAAALERLA